MTFLPVWSERWCAPNRIGRTYDFVVGKYIMDRMMSCVMSCTGSTPFLYFHFRRSRLQVFGEFTQMVPILQINYKNSTSTMET
jgi:hypothetical protein